MTPKQEIRDIELFGRDMKLTDEQIRRVLEEYETGTAYGDCIQVIRNIRSINVMGDQRGLFS
jgi:hypothetical protein